MDAPDSAEEQNEALHAEQNEERNADQHVQDEDDYNEEGPGINGDLASWLYVLGGIPMMALFFVVMFGLIGSCDARNIMLYG